MYEDSILILFSDHLPYAKKVKDEYNTLFLIFPGIPKKNMNITREMTYYDFAHTILHLVGITDYSPGFPFGNNIYDQSESIRPLKATTQDLRVVYQFMQKELRKKPVSQDLVYVCFNGNIKYNSSFPCNETVNNR